MHVGLGVCGIGKGHSSRQFQLAKELTSRGHQVTVIGYGEAPAYFNAQGICVHDVWVPFIAEIEKGLSLKRAIKDNYKTFLPGMGKNVTLFSKLFYKGYPDVFVTDYEPVTAQLAYISRKPLILFGQQSKFRHWNFDPIENFNAVAEQKRLELFFPKFDKSFVVSYHPLPALDDSRIQVVPPPIPEEIKQANPTITKNVVVYFSSIFGTGISQSLEEFADLAKAQTQNTFTVYSNDKNDIKESDNFKIKKIDRKSFIQDLISCEAVISTAGFTLISEAAYLGKPFYSIPLPTYDQNFCAKYIAEHKIGVSHKIITPDNLGSFLTNVPRYAENLAKTQAFIKREEPLCSIAQYIEGILDNEPSSGRLRPALNFKRNGKNYADAKL
ncbi:MAG: hypothetical protein EOM37_05405 [Proteobacteria bacterium]|nr:hypothetical protein [Pseudomonadota bacterium]